VTEAPPLHLAVALDDAGGTRPPGASPGQLFAAAHWSRLAAEAEHGLLDFITMEDALAAASAASAAGSASHACYLRGRQTCGGRWLTGLHRASGIYCLPVHMSIILMGKVDFY
jgi:hypothetical protein